MLRVLQGCVVRHADSPIEKIVKHHYMAAVVLTKVDTPISRLHVCDTNSLSVFLPTQAQAYRQQIAPVVFCGRLSRERKTGSLR